MSDEEDPLVTKPFKFVTGKSPFNGLDVLLLMLLQPVNYYPFLQLSRKASYVSHMVSTAWRHSLTLCIAPTDQIVVVRLRRKIPQSKPVRSHLLLLQLYYANFNQRTKHCWQNYVDYHKCILAKGEDFKPCHQVCPLSRL